MEQSSSDLGGGSACTDLESEDELQASMLSCGGEEDDPVDRNALDSANPDVVCAVLKALSLADEMDASQV